MFQSVKKSHGNDVLLSVTIIAMGEEVQVPSTAEGEEVLELTNLIIPGLRTVLARQRRDYGISEDFPAQFPVDEQAQPIPWSDTIFEETKWFIVVGYIMVCIWIYCLIHKNLF